MRRLPSPVSGSRDGCLAQRVVAEDLGGRGLRLADELAQQLDLVGLERSRSRRATPTAPSDHAPQARRTASASAHPAGCSICCGRPVATAASRRAQREAEVARRVLGQASRLAVAELEAAGVGVERFDGAAQHDVDERVDVELGRERVAHAAHRSLQAAALAYREFKSVLGLLDALAPVGGQQQQQARQRKDEQDREDVALGDFGGQEADRRQTGVDDPNQREDVQLKRRRDAARASSRRMREPASNTQQATNAATSSGKSARPSCERRPRSRTPPGPTACHASGTEKSRRSNEPRPRIQSSSRASKSPAATRNGTRSGRDEHEHRNQHELRRQDVAGAHRKLHAGEDHVEADEDGRHGRVESTRGAGEQQQASRGREEEQREHDLRDELAAREAPRPAVPGVLEETVGRRLAAHVVGCAHGLWLSVTAR